MNNYRFGGKPTPETLGLVKRFFWGFALLVGASCLVCGDCNLRGKGTWRVIPVSKWLITMVCFRWWWDFQMAIHGL